MSKYIKLDEVLVIANDYHNDDINAGLVESVKCLKTIELQELLKTDTIKEEAKEQK